jgi:hypothetical protein
VRRETKMPRNSSSSRRLNPTTTSTTKSVQFDTLEIVEFPFIIGDSPAVSSGCPLALDTRPIHRSTFDVNHYETHRRDRRRHGKKLMISVQRRAGLYVFLCLLPLLLCHRRHRLTTSESPCCSTTALPYSFVVSVC